MAQELDKRKMLNSPNQRRFLPGQRRTITPEDPEYLYTREGWQGFWRTSGINIIEMIDGVGYSCIDNWVRGRELRVFHTEGMPSAVVEAVVDGIKYLIRNIGLIGFSINRYGDHWSIIEEINTAIGEDGRVDGHRLKKIFVTEHWRNKERGGHPHADIVLLDRNITLGDHNWGQAEYQYGYVILAIPESRQEALEFIKKIAIHEGGHLLGYNYHHDSIQPVHGYPMVERCNMLWSAPTERICDKCLDALIYKWKGIEDLTGERFLNRT